MEAKEGGWKTKKEREFGAKKKGKSSKKKVILIDKWVGQMSENFGQCSTAGIIL